MNRKPNSNELDGLQQLVTSDPEITRGTPVFKGTRIPVDLVSHADRRPGPCRVCRSS